jgi:hypothetical protein
VLVSRIKDCLGKQAKGAWGDKTEQRLEIISDNGEVFCGVHGLTLRGGQDVQMRTNRGGTVSWLEIDQTSDSLRSM